MTSCYLKVKAAPQLAWVLPLVPFCSAAITAQILVSTGESLHSKLGWLLAMGFLGNNMSEIDIKEKGDRQYNHSNARDYHASMAPAPYPSHAPLSFTARSLLTRQRSRPQLMFDLIMGDSAHLPTDGGTK